MDVITFPKHLKTTSGLLILLHGFISLPDATSYDKENNIRTNSKDSWYYAQVVLDGIYDGP